MKTIIYPLFLCMCSLYLSAQEVNLEWAKQMLGDSFEDGRAIATDANGNVYATGHFLTVVDFDPGPGTTELTSNGSHDIFIQKLDPNGNLVWVRQIGGTAADRGYGITIDVNGNVYTVGEFQDTVDFDPGTGTTELTSSGFNDIFIQKMDSNGNFIWARHMGGGTTDWGLSIATDSNENVYTTGYFAGTSDFDPGVDSTNLTTLGLDDIFIQKLDANGNLIWVKQMGGTGMDQGRSITIDGNSNVYTTGRFSETVDFDPGPGIMNLSSKGALDSYIQKLDSNGNFLWVRQMGGIFTDEGNAITLDVNGNICTTGIFTDTVDFDPGVGTTNLIANGQFDIFIQKLDPNGNFLWAKQMGGISGDYGNSITTDANGSVYTTGTFEELVDFDPGLDTTILDGGGGRDVYIQKLDSNGNFIWVRQIGNFFSSTSHSITVDVNNSVLTIGSFSGTADFDPGIDTLFFTSLGGQDIFIQKLSQCSSTFGTDVQTACEPYTWIDGITYTSSNDTASYTLVNAAGCDSLVTLDLTIQTIDTLIAIMNHTIIANNDSATYQWIDCVTNTILVGETSQTFTPAVNGTYAVILTENGCSDTSECVILSSVAIEQLEPTDVLRIYPNPSKDGRFSIQSDAKIERIQIYDLKGRLLLEKKNQIQNLYVPELQSGLYYIQIDIQDRGMITQKLVITR